MYSCVCNALSEKKIDEILKEYPEINTVKELFIIMDLKVHNRCGKCVDIIQKDIYNKKSIELKVA